MGNSIIGASLTDVFTADQLLADGKGFGVNDRYVDHLGNEYVFVQYGTGGATANFAVSITHAGAAVMTTTTVSLRGERIGVAMSAAVANDFGWAMIYGATNVQTDVASVNTLLNTTATAGQLDDATTTGTKQIVGLVLTTAKTGSAGLAPAFLNYPTVGATN